MQYKNAFLSGVVAASFLSLNAFADVSLKQAECVAKARGVTAYSVKETGDPKTFEMTNTAVALYKGSEANKVVSVNWGPAKTGDPRYYALQVLGSGVNFSKNVAPFIVYTPGTSGNACVTGARANKYVDCLAWVLTALQKSDLAQYATLNGQCT